MFNSYIILPRFGGVNFKKGAKKSDRGLTKRAKKGYNKQRKKVVLYIFLIYLFTYSKEVDVMPDCVDAKLSHILVAPDYEQLIMAQFGEEIPSGHGVVVVREYPEKLLRIGSPIAISTKIRSSLVLDLNCHGASIVNKGDLIFVLYRKGGKLRVEQYFGEPIFKRLDNLCKKEVGDGSR